LLCVDGTKIVSARDQGNYTKESTMAKGQLRGNKEAKKPKKDKTPAAPAGGFAVPAKADKTKK
jgi:hypothetical protein